MSNLTSLEFFKQVLPIPSDGKEYFVVDIEPKYKVEKRKTVKQKLFITLVIPLKELLKKLI